MGDYDKSAGGSLSDGTTTYQTMNIDKDKYVNELIDGFDAASVPDNLVADRLDSAGYAMGVSFDTDLITLLTTKGTAKEVNKMKLPDASLNHEELLNAYQKLGIAVVDLIEAVFGTEDTKTILEFYRNDYAAMSAEVIPFITTVVLPDLRKITQDNKRDILSKYNRKQRRSIKRMMKK